MDFDYSAQRIFRDSIAHLKDVNFFRAVDHYCMDDCDNIFADICEDCPVRKACDDRYKKQK